MLEASRQQNVIVAMDTGSGKTHIAVLRIIDELERGDPEKLVWFLAPTVDLCLQQHKVIAAQIPSAKTRVLTGLDNIDRWTEQAIWNAVLQGIRVVVSTHAVLADALNHGFVRMSQLALIIFDEAHHCMRRHPANKIMQNHYHPTRGKFGPRAVPRILGLTASPIVRSSHQELLTIEANLDAVCKTPRIHRAELLEHVRRPRLELISYSPCEKDERRKDSRLLLPLMRYIESFDLQNDPYIRMLRQKPGTQEQADNVLKAGKTFCSEQLAKFLERSHHIYEELGGWATDYFIKASIDQLRRTSDNDTSMTRVDRAEKAILLEILLGMPVPEVTTDSTHISPKLETLLSFLEKVDHPEFSGLIFAKRRATVSILVHILSMHPVTKNRFRSASYVGWSNNTGRKVYLGDLLSRDTQRDTLSEFRAGRKNLIVATDVLEEGLDVSKCSLVVCYNKPANLKSFIQRRGRARHQQSTYAVMISTKDESLDLRKWQVLEQAMVKAYQDAERRRREARELESFDEDVAASLFVPSTSARMSADDAMQHLLHFCAVLPIDDFVDNRPMFSFEEDMSGRVRGTVTLPNSVHPAVRRAQGKTWWRTERAARKEAAFEAYKALHVYGLVNDNLLPLTRKPGLRFTEETNLPSVIECSEQYDPYVELAHAWTTPQLHRTVITVSNKNNGAVIEDLSMSIVLPEWTAMPDPIPIYWERGSTCIAQFARPEPLEATTETITRMRNITSTYLQALSSRVRGPSRDFVALFVPLIPQEQLEEWTRRYEGTEKVVELYSQGIGSLEGIVRDTERYGKLCLFRRWIREGDNQVYLECELIPRRRNLLQVGTSETALPKVHVIPASGCTVDRLPASKAMPGLLISALLDRFEATLVANRLNDTILMDVGIQDLSHILTAITTPIAQAATDYQRYEFFGDSILKFTVSYHLFFTQPKWHEGYLSESRDKLINNKRLARAALDTGLDSFILTDRFTPRKISTFSP